MTLEKGKSYGQEQIQQTLQDKARTRLNNPAPHQAPQRERVSRAHIPSGRSGGLGRVRSRRWKTLVRPDLNMGVPQLMMILEPNVVWEHTKAFVSAIGKDVEATVTPGEFFDGWHKGGRRAHGVYEGSYWELMGDCDELSEMLRKMSKAPALLEEPPLELPPPPELPSWDDFKPNLHLIPAAPTLPALKLPPFRAPILEPEPPFMEPEFLPVPSVPPVPKEEQLPIFIPPEFLQVEALQEPQYVDPAPPVLSDPPRAPTFGQPKTGHDWSGERPFQLDLPDRDAFMAEAAAQRVMDTSRFVHPPGNLPLAPEMEPLDPDLLKGLDMEPIPRFELAWMGGPEPDPPYASVPASPAALSRHSSRATSLSHSRPMSALQHDGTQGVISAPQASTSSRPTSARPRSSSAYKAQTSDGGAAGEAAAGDSEPAAGSSAAVPRLRSARRTGLGSRPSLTQVKTPEEQAWEEARSVASEASGTPRMWVNFAGPFADLPPIMMPPRPDPGPEPLPEDFPHEALEELPAYEQPVLVEQPTYVDPPQFVPAWAPPCEPRPVGFLRGSAPVIICDVSGTMNPRQQGRFRDMKRCAVELLDPEGEVATAAAGFDVLAFAGNSWSWSAGYGERMGLLQSSQVPYSGRQVGGRYSSKTPPGSGGQSNSRNASPDRRGGGGGGGATSRGGLSLMPTQPDLMADAQRWVANWPTAVGQTNLLTAFSLAEQHADADCWYILSDGMAHDQQACLEFLSRRNESGTMPVIHAVGFIPAEANPDSSGERFLRGIAELTGGSYQRYTPDIAKVWITGQGFVKVDLRNETPEQREERQWAEKQLRAERIKNLRLGIMEPLEVTMERVMELHQQLRVMPALRINEAAVSDARRRHATAMESVRLTNERRTLESQVAHEVAVSDLRSRNQAKVDAAREAFLQSHTHWERHYLDRLQDWEEAKQTLETQREEQIAAARAAAPATPGKASRPTSATVYASYTKTKAGGILSPRLELSDQRTAFASAEYSAAMGLDRHVEKLSPSPTPPGSRPVSGVPLRSSQDSGSLGSGPGSAPVSYSGGASGSRPMSAKPSGVEGGASEYLEAIAEDLAEASAPVDALFVVRRGSGAAAGAGGVDDDDLDVRPTARRSGDRSRDQDSAGGSRPAARPMSGDVGMSRRPMSGRVGSRIASATSATSASRKMSAGGLGMMYEGVPLPPPLPEPSEPLRPLRGERSEEFKRRLLPNDVVEEHDASNAGRLDAIRARWEAIIAADMEAGQGRKLAAMRRNAARFADYKNAVYECYASGLIRDIVYGGAVRVAANQVLMDNGAIRYKAEVERVHLENERLRVAHAAEVDERRAKEEAHAQAYSRWQDGHEAALREHESAQERARAEHDTNLTRLRAEWRAKTQQVLELNEARLTEAEAIHESLVETIRETNRVHKTEHTELLRQRKEVETVNLGRLAEAKAVHKVRLECRAADNELLVKQSMEEHQALCVRLTEEYDDAKVQAGLDHAELGTFLRAANDQLTEEARRRYQEALSEVQGAYEADCAAVREGHSRDLERVRRYNQDIWPKVHVARLAQAEMARVQVFAEHIRHCANKFEMGVNLMPNTPNYDRVVEMQALTEALARAFPDMSSCALPWPDHERRLEPGTGWVAAPTPRPLTYRDPADIINRIAKGKTMSSSSPPGGSCNESPRGSPAAPRGHSAGSASSPNDAEAAGGLITSAGSVDDQPQYQAQQYAPRHLSRPLSAGRARFAGVLSAELAAGLRPMSAALPGPSSARVEAWGTAAVSALSSPGGAGVGFMRPQSAAGYHNPSAWRRSNTAVLRATSPRGASHLGSAAAAAAAVAAAMGSNAGRPGTARPGTAQAGLLPAGGPPRPRSAGSAPRPARVAVDIVPLQASMARSKAQAGAYTLTTATLAGFAKDVPKLRYPEVDVQQPLTIAKERSTVT